MSLASRRHEKYEPKYDGSSLAAEAGINPDDTKAVRRFDKKREGRTTSNKKWVKPHDPDDNVGMTKHGAWDMIYKPEQITDLEIGVIVAAEVPCGDEGDTTDLAARLLAAGETLAQVCEDPKQAKVFPTSPPTKVTSRWRRSAVFRRNGCG